MNNVLGVLLFLLNPPPAPPPSEPPPESELSYEEQVEYEARYSSCDSTWNPDQCRADLYEEYYG